MNFVKSLHEKLTNLIPQQIKPVWKKSETDFSRNCKLPFGKLVVLILSLSASGKSKGVDIKAGEFFKNTRRSDLWIEAGGIHRSALTKAREKVTSEVFEDIFHDSVNLAYDLYPKNPDYDWNGMSVFGIDGCKVDLPATKEIRKEFDPDSGLENQGRGHYPQCLVSTAYDVFRQIPIARTIVGIPESSERDEVKQLLSHIPPGNILLFDRGYPSYALIKYLIDHYVGNFLFRCPALNTFSAVQNFIKSRKRQATISIDPTNNFIKTASSSELESLNAIKIRVIRVVSPDGTVSVLLTSLFNKKKYIRKDIIALYFKRWGVEDYYRTEKTILEVEKFHSKTVNGIRQELFAIAIMSVIARLLTAIPAEQMQKNRSPQFKNAVMSLASEAAILLPDNPEKSAAIFSELLNAISKVIYYKPKKKRPSNPRVCKKPINKWCESKIKNINK